MGLERANTAPASTSITALVREAAADGFLTPEEVESVRDAYRKADDPALVLNFMEDVCPALATLVLNPEHDFAPWFERGQPEGTKRHGVHLRNGRLPNAVLNHIAKEAGLEPSYTRGTRQWFFADAITRQVIGGLRELAKTTGATLEITKSKHAGLGFSRELCFKFDSAPREFMTALDAMAMTLTRHKP